MTVKCDVTDGCGLSFALASFLVGRRCKPVALLACLTLGLKLGRFISLLKAFAVSIAG